MRMIVFCQPEARSRPPCEDVAVEGDRVAAQGAR